MKTCPFTFHPKNSHGRPVGFKNPLDLFPMPMLIASPMHPRDFISQPRAKVSGQLATIFFSCAKPTLVRDFKHRFIR
jgi:hypothetical protein